MKLLKFAFIAIICVFFAALWFQQSYPDSWDRIIYPLEHKDSITKAARRYAIDPYLITAIIYEESKFDSASESKVGAIGLMQIMPNTGKWIAEKQGQQFVTDDLYRPEINIDMGCWYYRFLWTKYKDERLALAAYNSGYKNVDRWLKEGDHSSVDEVIAKIPFKETRVFVQRVQKSKKVYERLYPDAFTE